MSATRPKLKVNIREKDLGMRHFLREAAKLRKKPFIKAGCTQAKGSAMHKKSGKTNAEILAINEYGGEGDRPPARKPLTLTLENNQAKYDAHIALLRGQIFDANTGMTVEKALKIVGMEYVSDVKNAIRSHLEPANAPSTIAAKGSDVPLVDTSQLIQSLGTEVVMSGEGSSTYSGEGPRSF